MTGGLIQLITEGAQDIMLTGDPTVTYFKTIYQRYSNFSIDQKDIYIKRKVYFGNEYETLIPKSGDLLHKMILYLELPNVRTKYQLSPQQEINKLLQENNAIIYDPDIFNSNVAILENIIDLVDNSFINNNTGFREPIPNRFLILFEDNKIANNFIITVDIIKIISSITIVESITESRNIREDQINEYLLDYKKFNIFYNKLSNNNDTFNIIADVVSSLIDLDFNLDLLQRTIYEAITYNDIYFYLLFYINKLIQDFSNNNVNLNSYRDLIVKLVDDLKTKVLLNNDIQVIYRLDKSGNFTRKYLKTFDNNEYGSNRLDIFITGNFNQLFENISFNNIYYIYTRVPSGNNSIALNIIEILLFKKGFFNELLDESTIRYQIIRNSLDNIQIGYFVSDIISGQLSEIISFEELPVDETTETVKNIFSVQTLLRITVNKNIITLFNLTNPTGRILYIYQTNMITDIPNGYLKILILENSDYNENTDTTTFIIGINKNNINNIIRNTFIIDEGVFLSNPNIFKSDEFTSVSVNTSIVKQFDSYETYRFIFNDTDFNIKLIDETFRTIVFNSIQYSLTTNIILQRNIFESYLKNNLHIYQRFTLTNDIIDDSINNFQTIPSDKNLFLNQLLLNDDKTNILTNTDLLRIPYIYLINNNTNNFIDIIQQLIKNGIQSYVSSISDIVSLITFYQQYLPSITITINQDLTSWNINIDDILQIKDGSNIVCQVKVISTTLGSTTIIDIVYHSGDFTEIKSSNDICNTTQTASIQSVSNDFVDNWTTNITNYQNTFNINDEFTSVDEKSYSINYLFLDYLFIIYQHLGDSNLKNNLVVKYTEIFNRLLSDSYTIPSFTSGIGDSKLINLVYTADHSNLENRKSLLWTFVNSEESVNNLLQSISYNYVNILNIATNYITNYQDFYFDLFNAESVGATTSIRYQNIIEEFDFVLTEFTNNFFKGTISNISNLGDIINFLINEKNNISNDLNYYNNNFKIFNILNIYLDETQFYSIDSSLIKNEIINRVIKTTNPLTFYDEYNHNDTTIFNQSLNKVFNSNLTIDDNMISIQNNFLIFYNDLLLVRLAENSLEVDVNDFILKSNIIRIIETEITTALDDYIFFNGNFTSNSQKEKFINEIIVRTENEIIKKYIPNYVNKYVYFKSIIVTNTEKESLINPINNINKETLEQELIRLIIDEIRHGERIEGDPFLNMKLLTALLFLTSDLNKNGDLLWSDYIELFEIEYQNIFGLGYDFTIYKSCVITKEELQMIQNNNFPNSLILVDNKVVRKSDLPFGFIYDKTTDTLVRTQIYDKEYYFMTRDIFNIKEKLLIDDTIDSNILFDILDTRKINIDKLLMVFNDKNIELFNILKNYDSLFFFMNQVKLDMLSLMKHISDDIIYNKYLEKNIRIDYILTNDKLKIDDIYSQSLDPNRIINTEQNIDLVGGVASLIPNLTGLRNNSEKYLEEFLNNQKIIESLIEEITSIQNRQSSYAKFAWTNRLSLVILEWIEYRLNDMVIEKQYGDWMNIWYELTFDKGHQKGLCKMTGLVPELTNFNNELKPTYRLTIPLLFTFCRHNGLALPLIALPHTQLYIKFKLRDLDQCVTREKNIIYVDKLDRINDMRIKTKFIANYIYLDKEERNLFAKSKHEYLIEQLQSITSFVTTDKNVKVPLEFKNPCIDFYWIAQPIKFINGSLPNQERQWFNYSLSPTTYINDKNVKIMNNGLISQMYEQIYENNQWFDCVNTNDLKPRIVTNHITINGKKYISNIFTSTLERISGDNPIESTLITLNNRDRLTRMNSDYFNLIQPYGTHLNIPTNGINYYSFALYPKKVQQPSGAINMSFTDQNYLELELNDSINENNPVEIRGYTRSKNILRIISGLAGVAFYE